MRICLWLVGEFCVSSETVEGFVDSIYEALLPLPLDGQRSLHLSVYRLLSSCLCLSLSFSVSIILSLSVCVSSVFSILSLSVSSNLCLLSIFCFESLSVSFAVVGACVSLCRMSQHLCMLMSRLFLVVFLSLYLSLAARTPEETGDSPKVPHLQMRTVVLADGSYGTESILQEDVATPIRGGSPFYLVLLLLLMMMMVMMMMMLLLLVHLQQAHLFMSLSVSLPLFVSLPVFGLVVLLCLSLSLFVSFSFR